MTSEALSGFKIFRLTEMIQQLGEERVEKVLSSFCSPMNEDIEYFLKQKAVPLEKQSVSRTHLVYASFRKKPVLTGYFTLSTKIFDIPKKSVSSNMKRKINRFGNYNSEMKCYTISAPLIAQLGKNYTNGYDKLITGDELLQMACDIISDVQLSIGGKIAYIECEDKSKLINFYEKNGFRIFSKRELDKDDKVKGKYLIQMLKVL